MLVNSKTCPSSELWLSVVRSIDRTPTYPAFQRSSLLTTVNPLYYFFFALIFLLFFIPLCLLLLVSSFRSTLFP